MRMGNALDNHSDGKLLARMRAGDEEAFLQLYQRHRVPMFRFAFRMLGTTDQAEDVTHDCFLSLIRDSNGFDPDRGSLRTYLYAAVRNLALKRFRHLENEVGGKMLEEKAACGLTEEPLRQAISRMSPLQREVVLLFEYEEQSLIEIASIVGADVGTVKSRLFRGRESLRRELAPYLNGGGKRRENSGHE
jgi:RNA polymerase sigma-70 factor (ECF subfamily)